MTTLLDASFNGIVEFIKETSPDLSDEEIAALIEENRPKICLILYDTYIKNLGSQPLSWARKSRFVMNSAISALDQLTGECVSELQACKENYEEIGEYERAERYNDLSTDIKTNAIIITNRLSSATGDLARKIGQEEQAEKDRTKTLREIEGLLNDNTK